MPDGTQLTDLVYKRRELLYYLLRHRDQLITRSDLVDIMGVSQPAVTTWLKSLLKAGLVKEVNVNTAIPMVGRPRMQVSIAPDAAWVGALHITYRTAEIGLVNIVGETVKSFAMRWEKEDLAYSKSLLKSLVSKLQRWVTANGIPPERMLGLGVATSGPIDNKRGVLLSYLTGNDGWQPFDVPLRSILAAKTSWPIYMDTNAWAIAMGERWFGAGNKNFIVIHVSEGIGMGTVLNGQLWRGGGLAGELIPVTTMLQNTESQLYGHSYPITDIVSRKSILNRLPAEKGITGLHQAVEMAQQGDADVLEVLMDCAEAISLLCTPLANALDPEAIVLSGPIFRVPQVMDYIRQYVKAHSFSSLLTGARPAVVPASFQHNAGLVGAASLVYNKVFYRDEAPDNALASAG